MDTVVHDLRYAVRQILRSPGFTVVAVVTLALGIGANTALFTLANSMLLRARPGVGHPNALVWVAHVRSGDVDEELSYPDFIAYRDRTDVFTSLSIMDRQGFALVADSGEPVRVTGQVVSGSFFSILEAQFALGRGFIPEEDSVPGTHAVVVISYDLWQRQLGADPAIVGRILRINGIPFTVVGVTAEGFNGADHEDHRRALWVPAAMMREVTRHGNDVFTNAGFSGFQVLGRLRGGVTRERADAAVARVAAQLALEDSSARRNATAQTFSAAVGLPASWRGDPEFLPIAAVAFAVTGLVLLIACANVSNLLLGRGLLRRREIAVRLSIGANRRRLVRQLLTESVLLALLASALGLVLSTWAVDLLVSIAIPVPLEIMPDMRVFAVAALIAFGSAVLFGLIPALDATRTDLSSALKEGAPGADRRRARLQSGFVIAQVSLSLVLLVTSGLFLRSTQKANRVDVGFEASDSVLAVFFDLSLLEYTEERARVFLDALMERVRALPGVTSASVSTSIPLSGDYNGFLSTEPAEGRAADKTNENQAIQNNIMPGFFRTIGLDLVRGRDFTAQDNESAPAVAIVSVSLARVLWPEREAIGQRVLMRGEDAWRTVIAVVEDAAANGVAMGPARSIYMPRKQRPGWPISVLVVRSQGAATIHAAALRRAIASIEPNLPITDVKTLEGVRDATLAEQRYGSTLLGIFGALALLLAVVGVYAVIAFAVGRRTREIGVRVAIGASQRQVVTLFIVRGMRTTLIGLGIGLALSLAMSQLLSSMLFGISPADAITFGGTTSLLATFALLACWIPARRAARVDPMVALRQE